jgi:hypothetical protein
VTGSIATISTAVRFVDSNVLLYALSLSVPFMRFPTLGDGQEYAGIRVENPFHGLWPAKGPSQ